MRRVAEEKPKMNHPEYKPTPLEEGPSSSQNESPLQSVRPLLADLAPDSVGIASFQQSSWLSDEEILVLAEFVQALDAVARQVSTADLQSAERGPTVQGTAALPAGDQGQRSRRVFPNH